MNAITERLIAACAARHETALVGADGKVVVTVVER